MNKFKQLFAILMAATMMLSMTITAFADDNSTNTRTLIINNAIAGNTYNAYQLLDFNGEDYTITTSSPWYNFISTNTYAILADAGEGIYCVDINVITTADIEDFANSALEYAQASGITATATITATDSALAIDDLPLGCYLLDGSTKMIVALDNSNSSTPLPATGGSGVNVFYILGSLLIMISVISFVLRHRIYTV